MSGGRATGTAPLMSQPDQESDMESRDVGKELADLVERAAMGGVTPRDIAEGLAIGGRTGDDLYAIGAWLRALADEADRLRYEEAEWQERTEGAS